MQPAEFDGAQVYVVGGSLSIGLAVAQRVAALGADVTLFARRREPLEQAAAAVRAACRRPTQSVVWRQLDVSEHEQVAATMGMLVGARVAQENPACAYRCPRTPTSPRDRWALVAQRSGRVV